MNELPLSKAYRFIEPGPVVLVTTADEKRANLMTMSWHMVMDFTPLIGCIIGPWDYSFTALSTNRECVIAIPTVDLASKVVKIGNCSGDEIDKFNAFGLTDLPPKN
jgi:flavin reductase (DIM6/NTAB) family NADH-FMN oxidoreductase RutF